MSQLKFWLVLLNLITFNTYAFAASMVPQMGHRAPTQAQQSLHDGCQHMTSASSHLSTNSMDVMVNQAPVHDMPCCKHMHHSLSEHDASCGCKAGACGTTQLAAVSNSFIYTAACSSSKVDAMSTVAPAIQRGQRLLRPPIR